MRLRGVTPPPRGSFAERVLIEMLLRERWQSIVMWETTAILDGLFRGYKQETVRKVVGALRDLLAKYVFQTAYDRETHIAHLRQELDHLLADKRRLARLEAMTVK